MKFLKPLFLNTAFVYLSSIILVLFSEKLYWYPPNSNILGLAVFYSIPTFFLLWAISYFDVRQIAPLFLAAALFGLVTEGVLTSIIYEAGLFDITRFAYTSLGWHGIISVMFGWYFLRKLLLRGKLLPIIGWGALVGMFWGFWSLVYWLPENLSDPELYTDGLGIWPVEKFAAFALGITVILAVAHWLLGKWFWQVSFKPNKLAFSAMLLIAAAYFSLTVIPVAPIIGMIKFSTLAGIILWGLRRAHKKQPAGKLIFEQLQGEIQPLPLVGLFAMPLAAIAVYGLATIIHPSETDIRLLTWDITVTIQTFLGGGAFLAAFIAAVFNHHLRRQKVEPS